MQSLWNAELMECRAYGMQSLWNAELMPKWYDRWMYDWETRLTARGYQSCSGPLEWGIDWTDAWPCRDGLRPGEHARDPSNTCALINDRIIGHSDDFSPTHAQDFAWKSGPCRSQHAQPSPSRSWKIRSRASEQVFSLTSPVAGPIRKQSAGECALVSSVRQARRSRVTPLERQRSSIQLAVLDFE